MNLEDLYSTKILNLLQSKIYDLKFDINKIKKALIFAKTNHEGQYRDNGEPYYMHPVEVAILVLLNYSKTTNSTIISALLHDVVEDCEVSIIDIIKLFGYKVGETVDLLTRYSCEINKITIKEIIDNLIISGNNDAIIIKICDRIHNLLTIGKRLQKKIAKKIKETLDCNFIQIAANHSIEIEQFIISLLSNLCGISNSNQNQYFIGKSRYY